MHSFFIHNAFSNKNKVHLFLFAFLLLLQFKTKAQYCATATTNDLITPSTTAQLTTSYSSGKRAFNFTAVAGRNYTFETCSQSTADTYLRLYSTATGGSVLVTGDDDCSSQSRIQWTCTTNGTYSILLTNYSCANLSAATRVNYYYTVNAGENCNNAQDLSTLTSPYSATTSGYLDDISTCNTGSPDRIFYIDVPNNNIVDIWQSTNGFDSKHYMGYGSNCSTTTQIYCVDDPDTQNNPWTNSTGSTQRVWFIVDGYGGGSGTFTLNWTLTTPCVPSGDQTSYGSGSWIGYVYNSSTAGSFTTYRGTVTESETFDRDMSTGTPTGATTNICSANSDLFAIRYKMTKSYTAGVYTFTVGADDGVRLSVDGGATWLINDWSDHGYRTLTGSAYLSGSTNVVLEYYENSSGARVSISSTMASPTTMQVPSGFINSVKYTTCSGTFYDSGGSGSSYSNDENYTVTFYPSTVSGKVRLTFTSFVTEDSYDGMMIYDGNSTSASLISSGLGTGSNSTTCPAGSWRGSLSGATLPKSAGGANGVVTSTATDGSLTIVFKSDGATLGSGWAATVSCYSPDYITQWVSMNVGSTDWCAGETRQVTVTIKNNGLLPWTDASGVDFNIGVKWNADPDYLVRVDAQNLAAGATATYSLTVTAPSTTGSNNLTFDVVRESCFWFASNATVCGYTAGPGNTIYSSSALNIKVTPTNVNAGNDASVCLGNSTNLSGSATAVTSTIFSENFESYGDYNLIDATTVWRQIGSGYWDIWNHPGGFYNGSRGLATYFEDIELTYESNYNITAYYNGLINATSYSNLRLNFYWKALGEFSGSTLYDYGKVVYSLNGTTWIELPENYYNQGSTWQYADINLSALAGQQFYIGFKWISDGSVINSPGFVIDDLSISGSNSNTYSWAPSGSLSASNITNPVATPMATTTYTMTVTSNGCSVTDNLVITVNNPASTSLANGDIVWHGGTSSAWATLANWKQYNGSTYISPSVLPSSATNVIIPANGTCVSNAPIVAVSGTSTVNNITIETGASLTMNSSSSLTVFGNWVNNGSFNAGTGTVNFNSATAQTISGSTSTVFNNLTMNNPLGLTVSKGFTINNELKFTSGNITAASSNEAVTFETSGFVSTTTGSVPADGKCIVGYCKKNTNSTTKFTFPVGSSALYRPAAITPSNTNTTTWTTKYFNVGHGDYTITGTNLHHVSGLEYWTIDRSTTSPANATIELSWASGSAVDANFTDLVVAHYNNTDWEYAGAANISGTSTSGFVSSSTAWSTFSPFTLGSKNTNNPLPVELTDFTTACQNQQVKINWTTQAEINNDFFGIERSADGILFNEIGRVTGHGTSNAVNYYHYFDEQSLKGTSYYRLNQHDFNGVSKLYPFKSVTCNDETDAISIYPNPNNGTFEISALSIDAYIDVVDVLGKKVFSTQSKTVKEKLQLTGIKPGVYFVVIKNASGEINTQKILIEL